jgi:hypothetical protein
MRSGKPPPPELPEDVLRARPRPPPAAARPLPPPQLPADAPPPAARATLPHCSRPCPRLGIARASSTPSLLDFQHELLFSLTHSACTLPSPLTPFCPDAGQAIAPFLDRRSLLAASSTCKAWWRWLTPTVRRLTFQPLFLLPPPPGDATAFQEGESSDSGDGSCSSGVDERSGATSQDFDSDEFQSEGELGGESESGAGSESSADSEADEGEGGGERGGAGAGVGPSLTAALSAALAVGRTAALAVGGALAARVARAFGGGDGGGETGGEADGTGEGDADGEGGEGGGAGDGAAAAGPSGGLDARLRPAQLLAAFPAVSDLHIHLPLGSTWSSLREAALLAPLSAAIAERCGGSLASLTLEAREVLHSQPPHEAGKSSLANMQLLHCDAALERLLSPPRLAPLQRLSSLTLRLAGPPFRIARHLRHLAALPGLTSLQLACVGPSEYRWSQEQPLARHPDE